MGTLQVSGKPNFFKSGQVSGHHPVLTNLPEGKSVKFSSTSSPNGYWVIATVGEHERSTVTADEC